MKTYRILPPYENLNPKIPRPDQSGDPFFVTVQQGIPVIYSEDTVPTCGIRVVHPSNPEAPSKALAVVMLYVPPMSQMALHNHEAEETYVIQSGQGEMLYRNGSRPVAVGDFIYLPPWCDHGIVNTGPEMLVVLLAVSPPNP